MMQVLSGGSSDVLTPAATEYIHFWPTQANSWLATENARRQIVAGNGRIKHLRIKLSAAPGGGGTYTFNLRINLAAAGPSVAITDPNTTGVDLVNVATTAKGDVITLECVPSGGATATPRVSWCAVYEDTDRFDRCIVIGGINNAMPTVLAEVSPLGGGSNWALAAAGFNNGFPVIAINCSVEDLYVLLNGAPGVGTNYVMAMQSQSTNKLSCTIADAATTGNSGATLATGIARGSVWNMRSNPNGPPTARQAFWGIGVRSGRPHEFMLMGGSQDAPTGTEYNILNGSDHTYTATESDRRILVPSCVVHGLIVQGGAALAGGSSAAFTVYKNGVATALTATITAGNVQAEDVTNVIYCDDGDELSLEVIITGSPGTDFSWGTVCRKAFYSLSMAGAGI